MRILVVGFGSIGRRHFGNLERLDPSIERVVLRRRGGIGEPAPPGAQTVRTLEAALATQPQAAILASPAACHVEDALALARQGVHLFVEKPLAHSFAGIDELLAECAKRSLVVAVGYQLRFCRPLRVLRDALLGGRIGRAVSLRAEVGQYLPDWRPQSDYRDGVSARSDLGGGVLLELSHEFDYVRWLCGEVREVFGVVERLGDLEIDTEDTAEVLLRFESGVIGSVHLDMLQRPMARGCRILGTEGTLCWDALNNQVRLWTARSAVWQDLHPRCEIDRNVMFLDELADFLDCVRSGRAPSVSADDGLRALGIALAAKESAKLGRFVKPATSVEERQ